MVKGKSKKKNSKKSQEIATSTVPVGRAIENWKQFQEEAERLAKQKEEIEDSSTVSQEDDSTNPVSDLLDDNEETKDEELKKLKNLLPNLSNGSSGVRTPTFNSYDEKKERKSEENYQKFIHRNNTLHVQAGVSTQVAYGGSAVSLEVPEDLFSETLVALVQSSYSDDDLPVVDWLDMSSRNVIREAISYTSDIPF
jgi:hypothetical protein